ncbi:hypothetical protein VSDG_01832 [Cytospora chrysosperma]|uniref:Altered inheritance of mitochondria protein 32 n=1 Tax=Cytospora chrysosperma TaxID=252740 RepID=A0A423WGY8_CYTCH|nr:hypothetical protein VSDG_01832 [Valsa sordida]
MSLRLPLHVSRQRSRQFALSLQRLYSARSKAPSFPTVPTCPPSACDCAATPPMPNGLEIDYKGKLNGVITGYTEHVLICTGKDDWPSRIEEDNSGDNLAADLKELFGRGGVYSDPSHNISVLNSSFPPSVPARAELLNSSAYLLPSFKYVPFLPRVSFDSVEALAKGYLLPEKLHPMHDGLSPIHQDRLTRKSVYGQLLHGVRDVEDIMVLICGHGSRDMRCGVMGPVLRDEFEAQLPRQGVEVLRGPVRIDTEDDARAITGTIERPALTARVGLISHIGGHKFAGNRPSGGRKLVIGAVISLAAGLLYLLVPDDSSSRSNSSTALNNQTFRKFTVVSNEQISPTSFILTVKPSLPGDEEENAEVIRKAWEHGLWSVEFKQPQLQIARHYTPLPPTAATPHGGDGPATLRFLIRRYDGGELRGPHLGFDVAARLGDAGRSVVFLAGGTGIAPALQLASRVLSIRPAREGPSVRILWASRSALDVAGCPRLEGRREKGRSWSLWSADGHGLDTNDALEAPGPIVQQLRDLEAAYRQKGSTLEFKCVVDEEGTRISPGDITREVSKSAILPRARVSEQTATSTQALSSSSCHLHSQRLLQNSTEEADTKKEEDPQVPGVHQCSCSGDGATGKNLFMISGPDGFVGAYVGPKVWAAGAERQGPLRGLVGELRKKDPKIWSDWLVLKQ